MGTLKIGSAVLACVAAVACGKGETSERKAGEPEEPPLLEAAPEGAAPPALRLVAR